MDIARLLPDRSWMSPQRRPLHDLLFALMGPAIAVVGGLLLQEDLTGFPLRFGLVWFALGLLQAGVRYGITRRRNA